jgi:hypothetical protein
MPAGWKTEACRPGGKRQHSGREDQPAGPGGRVEDISRRVLCRWTDSDGLGFDSDGPGQPDLAPRRWARCCRWVSRSVPHAAASRR